MPWNAASSGLSAGPPKPANDQAGAVYCTAASAASALTHTAASPSLGRPANTRQTQ